MFTKLIEWLKESGTVVKTIAGALVIITVFFAWDARYAKTVQVANDLQAAEQRTVQTMQEFKNTIVLDQDITRLNSNIDMLMKTKLLMRSYPNDPDLKEEMERLVKEREELQKKIKSCPPVVIIQPTK